MVFLNMRSVNLNCCCTHTLEQHAHMTFMTGSSMRCGKCENVMFLADDNIWEAKIMPAIAAVNHGARFLRIGE